MVIDGWCWWLIPSGYVNIAMENGLVKIYSEFSHERNGGSFYSYVSHYRRVVGGWLGKKSPEKQSDWSVGIIFLVIRIEKNSV